jgi:DNA-directed RNA polymerase
MSIEQQIELELGMINRGTERYWKQQSNAVDQGRGEETSYSKRLLPDLVTVMTTALIDKLSPKGAGRSNAAKIHLRTIDPAVACVIALKNILQYITSPVPVQSVALAIGARIEDDLKFTKFQAEESSYYATLIADFKRKNSTDYRYRHRVLTKTMNDREIAWAAWDQPTRLRVGVFMIETCIESTALVDICLKRQGKKTTKIMQPTMQTLAWIEEHMDGMAVLSPDLGPCVAPPRDWVSIYDGGYHTYELAQRVPFIKLHGSDARKALQGTDLSKPMQAANLLQRTAWKVNHGVLDAMQEVYATGNSVALPRREPYEIPEFPYRNVKKEDFTEEQSHAFHRWKKEAAALYTAESERVGKNLQFIRVLRQAREYAGYEQLHFVYQADFRQRLYATSAGLSPQGADFTKSLLQFRDAKQLGEAGWFWLRVHGANTYGHDKVTYAERVAFIDDNRAAILESADNPVSGTFWLDADKPWMFLAFAKEYAAATRASSPHDYRSTLPVGLDGSCNGLQNFSAMLRDAVGGRAVNLIPSATPADIYRTVADVVVDKLRSHDDELAVQWLAFGITRKCTKKPVMTLPYGSTKQTCRESIEDYIHANKTPACPWDTHTEVFKASLFLADLVWDSIGEVVIAAREAMQWLQKASRVLSKQQVPVQWTTPTGFRVFQANKKYTLRAVECQLMGRTALRLKEELPELCSRKQANGIAPNFVHSMDSSHLVLTTLHASTAGISDFAMIHDDFGTHACNIPQLHTSIRVAFVGMYERHDVLQNFKDEIEKSTGLELPELPVKGDLDIRQVLESEFFFG